MLFTGLRIINHLWRGNMQFRIYESLQTYGAEIIFFLFKTHQMMLDPVAREYLYQISGQEIFGKSDRYDQNATNFVERDADTERMAVLYTVIYRHVNSIPSIVLGLMVGSWSDRIGRKIPLVIGCIGLALGSLCFVISTSSWIPTIILFFLACSIRGLFCTASITRTAIYSYVADMTPNTERTTRMSTLLAVNFVGLFLGSFLAGVILEIGDFSTEFAIMIGMISIYAIAILFLMPYDKPALPVNDKSFENNSTLSYIRGTIQCLLKERNDNGRRYILASLCTLMLQQCFRAGEQDVLLFYIKRQGMSESTSMYSYLLAAGHVSNMLMSFVGVPFISGRLKLSDQWCVVIGTIVLLVKSVALSLSNQIWMLFLVFIICSPGIMTISVTKSMISKMVDNDENGKIFALISSIESVSFLAGSTLMPLLYQRTAHIYAGIVFVVEAALLITWLPVLYLSIRGYDKHCANKNDQQVEMKTLLEHAKRQTNGRDQSESNRCEPNRAGNWQSG